MPQEGCRLALAVLAALGCASCAAAAAAAAQPAGLAACLKAIAGGPELHLPGSPNYRDYANGLRIIRWHSPAAVVFPRTTQQVQDSVLCATASGVRPVPRGGGNSFEALSTGDADTLVIDLSEMGGISVDPHGMTATVEGGVRMGNLFVAVWHAGRAAGKSLSCVGGVWPQIGFGGLMAAGGYGSMARKHGLLADAVISAQVVDARGKVLLADATNNPELFFAIRGGGGGTYGIVVQATMKIVEVPTVALGHLTYRGLEHAVEVLDRFQRWAPHATPDVTFTFNLARSGLELKFYHLGPKAELDKLVAASGLAVLSGAAYASVSCDALTSRGWLATKGRPKLGCTADGMAVPKRVMPGGILIQDREASKYRGAIFTSLIPRAGLEDIKALLEAPGTFWKLFQFKAYGGVFSTVSPSFNAFPWRAGTLMHLEYGTSFGYQRDQRAATEANAATAAATMAWYNQAKATIARYESGRYAGYTSLDDASSLHLYWGANYARLQRAKARYDPANVFRNALSVPPAGGSTSLE